MQNKDESLGNCARCHDPLSGRIRYQKYGDITLGWHEKCYHEGARQLAAAMRIASCLRPFYDYGYSRSDDWGGYAPEEVIGDDFYGPTIF